MSRYPAPVSRRALLGGSLLSSLGLLLESRAGRADVPAIGAANPVLLCIFLRGAADGLSLVVPHTDDEYYRLRRSIAIPRPGQTGGAIELDGRFGLHPRLAPLKAAYDAGELALVHAVGSPHPTRSHFEAQDYMETAVVGDRSNAQGWLARYLKTRPATDSSLLRAVAVSSRAPLALRGYRDAVIAPSLRSFRLGASDALEPVLARGFERLYRTDSLELSERVGGQALGASSALRKLLRRKSSSPGYGRYTQDFSDVARVIKADVGLETAWLELGGWDTHRGQGRSETGDLQRLVERLAGGLAAFRADLGDQWPRVVVVVMSEFGRTVAENGTGGTDHGHGSAMLVLGGQVKGGRVLGDFPGLSAEHLYEGRDLPVTTDFRDVLAEVCERHLGSSDAAPLFPGFTLDRSKRLGLFG